MLTQNRVQDALPRLPEDVQRLGVQVRKATPNILLAVHLYSPDGSRDNLYLSNYATLHVKDALARLAGRRRRAAVRRARLRDAHLARSGQGRRLPAERRRGAGRAARAEHAGLGGHPEPAAGARATPPIQLNVQTLGRLSTPEQFADIIVKTDAQGRVTRIRDIGRVEIGAADYGSTAYMDRSDGPAAADLRAARRQLAGRGARSPRRRCRTLKKDFPPGVDYIDHLRPDDLRRRNRCNEVVTTIFVAILLVVGVVFLFLQTWRASIIPVIAIPVSLVGTFTVLYALGISLNNLSLFGLVLAVGIVVDDAIVVVENVERNIAAGMSPKEAAHRTMDEVGGALVSIALTLCAVFVPSAFLSGISGQFFRQFAVTIAASTVISCFVSLTLSPALCALLLQAA